MLRLWRMRFTPFLLLLCLALPALALAQDLAYVLAITDFHGKLEENQKNPGIAKVQTAIKEFRASVPASLFVAVGDLFTGSMESDLLRGSPTVEGLLDAGLALSALGNHEFDWDNGDILRWIESGLPFVCANIVVSHGEKAGKPPAGVEPFIIKEVGGIKLAFVGLITLRTKLSTKQENVAGLNFLHPLEALQQAAKSATRAGAEAIVVLAHLSEPAKPGWTDGVGPEIRTFAKIPGVQAVILGHSHEEYLTQEMGANGSTIPIVQPAYYGQGLAVVKFERLPNGTLIASASLDDLSKRKAVLAEDPMGKATLQMAKQTLGSIGDKVVGKLEVDLPIDARAPSLLGEVTCDAMRWMTKAEVAFINGGGIRGALEKGDVLEKDLYQILPFDNTLADIRLTGAELCHVLETSLNNKTHRCIQLSGIYATYDSSLPVGQRITLRRSNGSVIQPDDTVKAVTNIYLMKGGEGSPLPQINAQLQIVEISERDALRLYLGQTEILNPVFQGWLTIK